MDPPRRSGTSQNSEPVEHVVLLTEHDTPWSDANHDPGRPLSPVRRGSFEMPDLWTC